MADELEIERQKWLDELTVLIDDKGSGYRAELHGFTTIEAFFKNEKKVWDALLQKCTPDNQHRPPLLYAHVNSHLTQLLKDIATAKAKAIEKDETQVQFNNLWKGIKAKLENPVATGTGGKAVYSKSSIGIFVSKLYETNPELGEGGMHYFGNHGVNSAQPNHLRGYIDAHLFVRDVDERILERVKVEIDSLVRTRNEAEQSAHELVHTIDVAQNELLEWKKRLVDEHTAWTDNSKKEYDSFVSTKKDELGKLDETYREKLKLEAPVKYWRNRAKRYRNRGYCWLSGFIAVVVLVVALLTAVLYNFPEAFHHKLFAGEPGAIKGIIILGTIISFAVYLSRLFARLTFSSFHIERDAEEREQLTLVYLALIKEKAVSEKERDIILQALFSRVETGLLSGDSSPTMPNIGSLLEHVTKTRSQMR